MIEHRLFYYPYASLSDVQLPLLKVAALYFDKLVILDPVGASWGGVGTEGFAREAVELLRSAGVLEIVTPADVLAAYAEPISDAIRRDLSDREFLELCEAQCQASGRRRWTLSLAKVPEQLGTDQEMRRLLGDFAREVSKESARFSEESGGDPGEYYEYAEGGQSYDELRAGRGGTVEYRYADFPLALGESIMLNHALFAGLLHAGATPITDDPFHSRVLAHKLQRATREPAIRSAFADRDAERALKAGALAAAAFTDTQLRLPILDPATPLAEVLEYRQSNPEALVKVRETLGLMARRIEQEPWSADFVRDVETKAIPNLISQLDEATKARDAWLATTKTKAWVKAVGFSAAAASAVLAVFAAPVTPVALAVAGLGIASGVVVPGTEWLLDWRAGKKTIQENGLHYLVTTARSPRA